MNQDFASSIFTLGSEFLVLNHTSNIFWSSEVFGSEVRLRVCRT